MICDDVKTQTTTQLENSGLLPVSTVRSMVMKKGIIRIYPPH